MAVTEDEKRSARAYNIGFMLNVYEPRLMEEVIKRNPNNEFVKAMQVGRDHQEFESNIPRKDYSREFKNGFHNGRTLAEHNPELVDRLIATKKLSKDYRKGLESAKTEYEITSIQKKMKKEPKAPSEDLRNDPDFQKGFNVGYRLSERFGHALRHADNMNNKYSRFIDGVTLGNKQYEHDLSVIREKDPNAQIFPNDQEYSNYQSAIVENKLQSLGDISTNQLRAIEGHKGFEGIVRPKWLQKDRLSDSTGYQKDLTKDKDIEPNI